MAEVKNPKSEAASAKAPAAKAAAPKSKAAAKEAPVKAAPKAPEKTAAPKAAVPKASVPKPKSPAKTAAGPKVKVRLVRSGIGTPKDQRATLRGLGLTRMQQERELKDSPALRGMMSKVRHLISVDGQPAA